MLPHFVTSLFGFCLVKKMASIVKLRVAPELIPTLAGHATSTHHPPALNQATSRFTSAFAINCCCPEKIIFSARQEPRFMHRSKVAVVIGRMEAAVG